MSGKRLLISQRRGVCGETLVSFPRGISIPSAAAATLCRRQRAGHPKGKTDGACLSFWVILDKRDADPNPHPLSLPHRESGEASRGENF